MQIIIESIICCYILMYNYCLIFSKRGIQVDTKLCSQGPREYADIASRTSAVFVDKCDDQELLN